MTISLLLEEPDTGTHAAPHRWRDGKQAAPGHVQASILAAIDGSKSIRLRKHTLEVTARRLLQIVVYGKRCRIGGSLTLDDLAETPIGDWKMPQFRTACAYAASQGWLIVQDDVLTLTTSGLAAA